MREKHGHAGTIHGRIKDLVCFVAGRIEINADSIHQAKRTAQKSVAEDGRGIEKRGEADKHFCMLWLPRDLHDRAKGWQGNIPHKAAVERINLHFMMGIVHVGHHKLVVDHDYEIHHIILLGNKFLPVRPLWMLEINGNDTAAWSIQVGLVIKEALIIVMPGNTAELAPADDFRIIGTIINLADLNLLPVAATT